MLASSGGAVPMEILHLVRGQPPRRLETLERLPDEGFVWLDFVRDAAADWKAWPQRLLGVELDRRHVADSLEAGHKTFFDVTPDYDLLIFEGLGPRNDPFPFETRTAALFIFDRLLVSVRASDNISFDRLRQRFADGRVKSPGSPRVLAQIVLDIMVDRYLAIRELFTRRMDELQEDLLDPKSPFDDWRQLLVGRREARRLETLCEDQLEALDAWHRTSRAEWSNAEETRLRDVSEHIARVLRTSADLERHIEAAVQLYFASMSHRTNEIVRTLTVFSAVFLPLTFIVGIYGMNFQYMPELAWSFAYPLLLMVMVLVAGGLLIHFRRRGYF
jgi:magnesium/cobalt transport protein CorA